ncbi:hypothetical protein GCM10011410_14340 [Hoyosella rhizosphaerae]|uniref:2-oxo-4-hydroxy-4-carboxy-5-ureidoimidazoline decarboxylase n=1 Tax=Hoyosella rhizosphaerae TaxID=1755582 RepID=A0A916XDP5_9ACTN|nr:hypothetical protein GCM10011410_14340 [Hoyosella rhizosphaerae]
MSGRSADEQARVSAADDQVLSELIALNELYEATFGHVYLVFAHGRSAEELVAVLKRRMSNDTDVEWRNTRLELAKITEFRLRNLFGDERV